MDYSGSNQLDSGSSGSGSGDFEYQDTNKQSARGDTPSPSPPPPPPPPAKRFNWLACCGISCGVLLLIGIITGIFIFKFVQGGMDTFQPMLDAAEQVEQTDLATIKAEAKPVSSLMLAANPSEYTSGWIELEGSIIPDPDGGSQYPGGGEGTTYFVADNVLVIDSSNSPRVGSTGDTIRCWGKAVVFDLTSIPLIGGLIEQAMKQDPNVPDLSNLVLFMAKSVELVGSAAGEDTGTVDELDDNPCGDSTGRTQDDGWL